MNIEQNNFEFSEANILDTLSSQMQTHQLQSQRVQKDQ